MSSEEEEQVAFTTPSGRVVMVDRSSLSHLAQALSDVRQKVFDDLLEMLDRDYERMKDCGDLQTAESIEVIRAKVRAKRSL